MSLGLNEKMPVCPFCGTQCVPYEVHTCPTPGTLVGDGIFIRDSGSVTVVSSVDTQAREAHIRDQAYKEGLRVGLDWGRKVTERVLKQSLAAVTGDFNPRNLPANLQRSADDGTHGLSLGDPFDSKSRVVP